MFSASIKLKLKILQGKIGSKVLHLDNRNTDVTAECKNNSQYYKLIRLIKCKMRTNVKVTGAFHNFIISEPIEMNVGHYSTATVNFMFFRSLTLVSL